MPHRVAVTGIGLVTPLGTGTEATWAGLKEGRSGVGPVTHFDATALNTRFAGEVTDFNAEDFLSRKEAKRLERSQTFALAASDMAMKDGGFTPSGEIAHRGAVIIGSSVGGLAMAEKEYQKVLARGPRAMNPLFILGVLPNMLPAQVAIRHGFKGPNWGTNSACSTSAHALGEAARLIRYGEVDFALAGGAEAPICVMGMGGFSAIRALSTRNDDPEGASRPFDQDRDGFVLGEGSAVLLLEEWGHAEKRGARIYGELVGYGVTGDAHHLTAPAPGHEGAQRCMTMALAQAGLAAEDVGYINAHATSTEIGDRLEAEAIRAVFGSHAASVPVSATKSMTGHMTGASGAAEAAFCLLALRHGIIPPTINLHNPEEGLGLDCVPWKAREASLDVAMTNAFGFGGTNVTLIFKKP